MKRFIAYLMTGICLVAFSPIILIVLLCVAWEAGDRPEEVPYSAALEAEEELTALMAFHDGHPSLTDADKLHQMRDAVKAFLTRMTVTP